MKRNQTIVECDECGKTEVISFHTASELASIPRGWRQFANPDTGRMLLTFDAERCASVWFDDHIRADFASITDLLAPSDAELPAEPAAAVAIETPDGTPIAEWKTSESGEHSQPVAAGSVDPDDIPF